MELMSPLLLCALVALLPQTLGKSSLKLKSGTNFKKNDKSTHDLNVFIKFNETSNINKVSNLQSVFMDPTCKECHNCMEQSIIAHKIHSNMNIEGKANDVLNEIDNPEENTTGRNKRNLDVDSDIKVQKKKSKKSKAKKLRKNKTFSVTKYSDEDKIYALKVKETTAPLISAQENENSTSVTKCYMYRVKDSFSCDSPDAELILHETKRKNKDTDNKEKEKRETNVSPERQEKNKIVPLLIKHHVEDSQMSESFMPSIEEMY